MKYFILLQTDIHCNIFCYSISINDIDLLNFQVTQKMLKIGVLIELEDNFVL